jgi:branched-chain amino acid transport system substrate-binding protein
MKHARLLPLLVPFALVAAACGQKAGVAGSEAAEAPAPAPGTAAPPATDAPADTGAPGATAAPGADTSAPPADTAAPEAGPFEPGDGDTNGVTDDEIVIGIHAPVTGASPIPQTSFEIGKDIYWQFLAESAPEQLFGRNVRVVFRDDTFNPQQAVQVCREMVEDEGAFMLVGGGGADQITACAQYASENGIPYLSAGVNEEGLADLDTYFASTLTYAQQAPLLMQQLQERGITEFGLVVTDTPSFDGFVAAVEAAADEAGITVGSQTRISKTAAEPEQLSVVQALKDSGAQAVVLNTSPVVFIGLANQGLNQSYTPTWIGPGVTSGLNAVTNFGCPAVETGVFLSPTPNLDVIDQLDPNFRTAYEQFAPADAPVDDIGLQLWALNKALGLMFEATGAELGRAAFMNTLVTSEGFDNGIYSPVQFTVDDHFGGTGAHVLDADCTSDPKQFKTVEQFVSAG